MMTTKAYVLALAVGLAAMSPALAANTITGRWVTEEKDAVL